MYGYYEYKNSTCDKSNACVGKIGLPYQQAEQRPNLRFRTWCHS